MEQGADLLEDTRRSQQRILVGHSEDADAPVAKECVAKSIAQNNRGRRRSAIDGRTTSRPGYAISQRARKRVEEIFGWMKAVGGFRRTRFHGLARTQLAGYFVGAAYNLLRIARLLAA